MIVLLGGGGCTDTARDATSHPGQAVKDSIEAGYERLQRAYDSVDTVPPAMRKMRGAMGQMHAQMHGRMQGERGMGGGMHGNRGMHGMHEGQGMHGDRRAQGGRHDSMQMREWHQQMRGMHAQMARMHDQSGRGGLAKQHRQMERRHQRMMETLPSESEPSEQQAEPEEDTETRTGRGEDLYVQHCGSCHGPQGDGMGTAFPPLSETDWVTGKKERTIQILLHGLEGRIQVKEQSYAGVMPAFGRRLSDEEIAAILSYIRSSWGNAAGAVSPNDVRKIRRRYADRVQPWSAAQLRGER